MEREHEAHKALGDAASLMGNYDVKRRRTRSGRCSRPAELDSVVRSVEEVTSSGGLDVFFASLTLGAPESKATGT